MGNDSKIRVLDDKTINKIAAGEVIENTASVVKELVENSLDAGSTEIAVEIISGGRQLIRITDNGSGMNKDDVLLCLERHATSKIRTFDSLQDIATMGFRGEAIPSIASISKFMIISRTHEKPEASMVIVEGGNIIKCCSSERSPGTTVEVKSLFFNVPVRKRFLKSPQNDINEIVKTITSLALSYPFVKFELISDHQRILTIPASDISTGTFMEALRGRILVALGPEFLAETCLIEDVADCIEIKGFIGLPSCVKHNRLGQYLLVNQRPVVSPYISHAIYDGYGTSLPSKRHPTFVLHLKIPSELVDVNVHPQKREIRLRQEALFHSGISQAISRALQKRGIVQQQPSFPNVSLTPSLQIDKDEFFSQATQFVPLSDNRNATPILKSSESLKEPSQETFFSLPAAPHIVETPLNDKHSPKVLGTLPHYILVKSLNEETDEENEGLCIIDQKAAHFRILYEKLLRCLSNETNQQPEMQSLLLPITFELSTVEALTLIECLPDLFNMGISIREFGHNAFVVDAITPHFAKKDMPSLISEIIHDMHECHGSLHLMQEKKKKLALSASRAALPKGIKLSIEEAHTIVSQLLACDSPYHCPLGKPTIIHISPSDLAQHFHKSR